MSQLSQRPDQPENNNATISKGFILMQTCASIPIHDANGNNTKSLEHQYHLRYHTPANVWRDTMPLGNGKLGAMVYGHTGIERIQLNDDSLWYGGAMDRNNTSLKEALPEIRRLVLSGDIHRAEELIMQNMAGTPSCMRHYSTLGTLNLALNRHLPFMMGWMPESNDAQDYQSDLDLMTGILTVAHTQNGVRYRREMFISHAFNVLCCRLTASVPKAIQLDIMMTRVPLSESVVEDDRRPGRKVGGGWGTLFADSVRTADDHTLLLQGHDAETAFASATRVICDGALLNPQTQLLARDCGEVVLYLASSTSNRSSDPASAVLAILDAAQESGYEAIKTAHIGDFSSLMNRSTLDLGPAPDETTDVRLAKAASGERDPSLAALYYQFGRYLIVSGGRQDSSALNLQGIWNADFMPMWDSKYTININLQMNYWPVETCNLPELHLPLMDLLKTMQSPGRKTAAEMYGMRGMVCHHNTDYYGDCAPQDLYMAAMPWVTGSAWLGLHVWEHYLYTGDEAVLREMYPILKDMAVFYEDYLLDVNGKLLTCPSVSPENRYLLPDGSDTPVCASPAMDNQILREFFGACIRISRLLKIDTDRIAVWQDIIDRLSQDQIGSKGQLLEWDREYPELTPGMATFRTCSDAIPGKSINWRDTPDLMRAVSRSLAIRKEHGSGKEHWPLAWFINLHARLMDREAVDEEIHRMIAHSTVRNLLNATFVFQIDGNLGATAGIAECLLQSHIALHLLPSLPISWRDGSVTGLRARGGCEVDMEWRDGRLTKATIKPQKDGQVSVIGETLHVECEGKTIAAETTALGFDFPGKRGKIYTLKPLSAG